VSLRPRATEGSVAGSNLLDLCMIYVWDCRITSLLAMTKKDFMFSWFLNLFRKFLGLVLIFLGILSLFVPFVPGILLIVAGLWLFGGGNYFKKWFKKPENNSLEEDKENK